MTSDFETFPLNRLFVCQIQANATADCHFRTHDRTFGQQASQFNPILGCSQYSVYRGVGKNRKIGSQKTFRFFPMLSGFFQRFPDFSNFVFFLGIQKQTQKLRFLLYFESSQIWVKMSVLFVSKVLACRKLFDVNLRVVTTRQSTCRLITGLLTMLQMVKALLLIQSDL